MSDITEQEQEYTVICAWCILLGIHTVIKAGGPEISHGICPDCERRLYAESGIDTDDMGDIRSSAMGR